MKRDLHYVSIVVACLIIISGCATYRAQEVGPTTIHQAQKEITEEELLDVGIAVFKSAELTEEKAKEEGSHPDIRKAESHFMPYHLQNTLQQSSHWGAVRVLPTEETLVDLLVKGEIIESNGENLILKTDVVDASGNIWMSKTYEAEATEDSYTDNTPGEKDAYQDLYNTIANDMAAYKGELSPKEIQTIRTVSELKFAADFAPDAFRDYLTKDEENKITINRLPSDDDPMMARLLRVRERDHMYVDTLNEFYEVFYNEMWTPYEDWRKANYVEQTALREIKRKALTQKIIGALMVAAAIGLGAGGVDSTAALQSVMIVGGGAVIINGFNVSKEAEIHRMAIQELSESFGNEMKPIVLEFQGEKYELTGSAEEQYRSWRKLLREIYYTETGFAEPDASEKDKPADNQ
ncbi:MAG: hypothetical protein AMK69_24225 [Nitrospira bacterium SG8_3]|nr:MAG: hypothetical protein AMK69_24225 [Nitrospira bacterium SG8_3]